MSSDVVSAFQPMTGETGRHPSLPGWIDLAACVAILSNEQPPLKSSDPPKHARDQLFKALSTGQVRAMIDNGETRRPLRDTDLFKLEFKFDFTERGLRLFHGPGGLFDCWVHEGELRAFALMKKTSTHKLSVSRRSEIESWIVAFIDSDDYHSKGETLPVIMNRYGITEYVAKNLFDNAGERAERDVSKPGRKPKTAKRNQTTI